MFLKEKELLKEDSNILVYRSLKRSHGKELVREHSKIMVCRSLKNETHRPTCGLQAASVTFATSSAAGALQQGACKNCCKRAAVFRNVNSGQMANRVGRGAKGW